MKIIIVEFDRVSDSEQLLIANEQNAAATGAVATLNNIFDSQPDEALALVRAWIAEGAPA